MSDLALGSSTRTPIFFNLAALKDNVIEWFDTVKSTVEKVEDLFKVVFTLECVKNIDPIIRTVLSRKDKKWCKVTEAVYQKVFQDTITLILAEAAKESGVALRDLSFADYDFDELDEVSGFIEGSNSFHLTLGAAIYNQRAEAISNTAWTTAGSSQDQEGG